MVRPYATAVALVAAAASLRAAADPTVGDRLPYMVFLLPTVIIARWFGWKAGAFALLLGIAVGTWLFVAPRLTLSADHPAAWAGALPILALGAGVLYLMEMRRLLVTALRDGKGRLLDHAYDAVFARDPDGTISYWNAGAERLYGFTAAEAIGRVSHDLLQTSFPVDRRDVDESLRRIGHWEGELRHRTKHGRIVTVDSRMTAVAERGTRVQVLEANRDVSERKRDEEALRAAEERLRLFVEHVPAPIAMLDRDMRYLHVSRRWLTDYRLSDSDVTGRSHYDVFPDAPDHWRDIHRRCLAGQTERCDEERFERGDGTVQWVRWEVRPWYLPGGTVGGIIIFSEEITRRKRAEVALRERERLLGIVTSSARVGLVVVNARYEYLFANDAYADLYRFPFRDLVGRRVPDVLPDGWGQIQPRLDRALAGEALAYELSLPAGPGDSGCRWFSILYEPRAVDAGEPTVAVVVVEITAQKQAETTIRDSEARYRLLFERNLAAVLLTRADGAILAANDSAARLFGVESPAALRARRMTDFYFDPADREALAQTVVKDRVLVTRELRFRRGDGQPVWTLANISALEDGKEGLAFHSTLVDVTDWKRAEEDLRLRDRAIRDAALGILITDASQPDNPITYVSPGFERLTGYGTSEVLGRNCRFLQGRDTDPEASAQLRAAIRDARSCEIELVNYRKDGRPFWNHLSLSPVRDERGQLTHFIGVQVDVTDRRRLEEQLRQSQKMEAVGQLAGGVAHDFNNLLQVITGFGDLLLASRDLEDAAREMVAQMVKAGERAAGLTRQLLAFSRQQVLAPRVLDLNGLIVDLEKMLRRVIDEDIDLTTSLQPNLGRVKADPGQIEQVVLNLMVNARDAMPRGGKVTIETQDVDLDADYARLRVGVGVGPHVLLAVSDTGCGMTPDVRARIFEPFFTTKEKSRGTGLGLSTVFGIVRQAGGHIAVYSEPDVGTAFKIYLPRVEESPGAADPGILRPPVSGGAETVLLVEDEEAVRTLTDIVLSAQGYVVLTACDGVEALAVARKHAGPIHLLLSDVVMPAMGGRELAEQLLARHPGMKVLFQSGYTDDAVVRHGILHDTVHFLQKPYSPGVLAQKVRDVLDSTVQSGGLPALTM